MHVCIYSIDNWNAYWGMFLSYFLVNFFLIFKIFIYLLLERQEGRERNISMGETHRSAAPPRPPTQASDRTRN